MKFTNSGVAFNDKNDEASYTKLLSFLRRNGVTKFIISIEEFKKEGTSLKQQKLWDFVVGLIKKESGNDIKTINETLNSTGKEIKDLNNEEFNELLNSVFIKVKEFFNIELSIDKNGNIEQKL